jgi:plastocyanin
MRAFMVALLAGGVSLGLLGTAGDISAQVVSPGTPALEYTGSNYLPHTFMTAYQPPSSGYAEVVVSNYDAPPAGYTSYYAGPAYTSYYTAPAATGYYAYTAAPVTAYYAAYYDPCASYRDTSPYSYGYYSYGTAFTLAPAAAAPTRTAMYVAPADEAVTLYVRVHDDGFQPRSVSVPVGGTVVWKNHGKERHSVVSDTGLWDSGDMAPGVQFSFTFDRPGTYRYHCGLHPQMDGVVIVE